MIAATAPLQRGDLVSLRTDPTVLLVFIAWRRDGLAVCVSGTRRDLDIRIVEAEQLQLLLQDEAAV